MAILQGKSMPSSFIAVNAEPNQMKVSIDVSQPQGLKNQRSQKPAMYDM